jgi:hypothetical protein
MVSLMARIICKNCGHYLGTKHPMTIRSPQTGNYYHHDCEREYGTEIYYLKYRPYGFPFVNKKPGTETIRLKLSEKSTVIMRIKGFNQTVFACL